MAAQDGERTWWEENEHAAQVAAVAAQAAGLVELVPYKPKVALDAPGDYLYHTNPYQHQHDKFMETRLRKGYLFLWEMGCGKSKIFLDTAIYLWQKGYIDGVLVFAPTTVAVNWVTDEIPAHVAPHLRERIFVHLLDSATRDTPQSQHERAELVKFSGLSILVTSYSALMTKPGRVNNDNSVGKKLVKTFMQYRQLLFGLDESHHIKDANAKRTKTVRAAGAYAPYRRALSGSPVAVGPFDLYPQIAFCDPEFFPSKGIRTFTEFKEFFGVYRGGKGAGGRAFQQLVSYKNKEVLASWLPEISHRITKDEVLDLPPKLYSKRYFELTKKQQEIYNRIRYETRVEMEDGSWRVESGLAIQKLMRMYQVTCGYVGVQHGDDKKKRKLERIPGDNPRFELACSVLNDLTVPFLVWCWFTADVDMLCAKFGKRVARFDGQVSQADRLAIRRAFQAGDLEGIILNTRTSPEGLNLTAARIELYYTNGDDLLKRMQSEDRAHRIGTKYPVNILDLVCKGTVCEGVVRSMVKKKRLSDELLGDQMKEWL